MFLDEFLSLPPPDFPKKKQWQSYLDEFGRLFRPSPLKGCLGMQSFRALQSFFFLRNNDHTQIGHWVTQIRSPRRHTIPKLELPFEMHGCQRSVRPGVAPVCIGCTTVPSLSPRAAPPLHTHTPPSDPPHPHPHTHAWRCDTSTPFTFTSWR